MNHFRVGGVVYDQERKVVATFNRGAWYRHIRKSEEMVELEPLDPSQAKACEALPDALTLAFTGGEQAIMKTSAACIGDPGKGGENLRSLVDAIEKGVSKGLRKYGPFRPQSETRDLEGEVLRSLRNAVVFGSMCIVRDGGKRENTAMRDIVRACGSLWIDALWTRQARLK